MRPGTEEGKKEPAKGGRKGDSERRQPGFSHWADPQESACLSQCDQPSVPSGFVSQERAGSILVLPTGFSGAAVTKTPRPDCVHL